MKKLIVTLFASLLVGVASAQVNAKKGIGVSGYDTVAYFSGSAVKGDKAFSAIHQGVTYHFANAANAKKFKAAPNDFLPAYGGYCAYAMLEGEKVGINPKTFKVVDGKLYLYYNKFLTNTLELWNKQAGERGEKSLIKTADVEWAKVKK